MEKQFTAYVARDWKSYRNALTQTAQGVMGAFEGTDLAEKVNKHYLTALPQNGEGFVDFVRRNHEQSYAPLSQRMEALISSQWVLAKGLHLCSQLPLLKKLGKVSALTGELYLGQKQQELYFMKEKTDNPDENRHLGQSFDQTLDLDIDVGLENGLYLVRVNTHQPHREVIGLKVLDVFEDFFKSKKIACERSETEVRI
jgi:hypothetical protein